MKNLKIIGVVMIVVLLFGYVAYKEAKDNERIGFIMGGYNANGEVVKGTGSK